MLCNLIVEIDCIYVIAFGVLAQFFYDIIPLLVDKLSKDSSSTFKIFITFQNEFLGIARKVESIHPFAQEVLKKDFCQGAKKDEYSDVKIIITEFGTVDLG